MNPIVARVMGWGRPVLDALLPPQCLGCDRPVPETGLLCPTCFATMRFITAPCCDRCGTALLHAFRGRTAICAACTEDPPPWRRARTALQYDAASRALILPLKHADRTDLAPSLARLMARAGVDLLASADLLVPVPLHASRLRRRGYNQSGLLARALGQIAGVPMLPDALVRTRATASLAELSAERRTEMLVGAIAPRANRIDQIAGRRVILVDDVLTSGATARECTWALGLAGAASVDLLTAARTAAPRDR
jgi:ComF family protein